MTVQTCEYECEHCGELVSYLNAVHVVTNDIEVWCDECIENDAVECYHCGHLIPEDDAETVRVGGHERPYCPDCADEHATVCDCCDDLVINREVNRVSIYGLGRQDVCDSCLEDYYRCSRCGDYCTEDVIEYHDGEYYCPYCAPSDYLSDYHHTDAETFLNTGADKTQPYLGVELEVEFPDESSRANAAEYIRCNDLYGSYYDCKEDGSLGEYGMEVVTQPATPAYHMSGYNQLMLSAGTIYGATSHDNGHCGLHVHIDREYFVSTDIPYACDRAGFIMDSIISANEPYIMLFTRRTYGKLNHWAQLLNMTPAKEPKTLNAKLADYRNAKYTRYQAVNMENSDTIELRLFRGTLNPETYFATVEFAAALAYLTRALLPIPEYASTLRWPDLKTELFAALEIEGISSTELANYLKRRGL